MVSLGSVCTYIKYYCLLTNNTYTQSNAYILRDRSMDATLASSVHIPANLQTAPIPVPRGFAPISSRLVYRSIRPITTLLPSLFLRLGVCGETVNQLVRICTSSLLIFQKNLFLNHLDLSLSLPNARKDGAVSSKQSPFLFSLMLGNIEPGCLTCCHLHTFPGQT